MTNMTRRIFAALIPAAPIAARSGLGSLAQNIAKEPTPNVPSGFLRGEGVMIGDTLKKLVYPDNWNKYEEARSAVHAYRAYRYEMERTALGRENTDQNILALKSVSRQHKIHMMIKKAKEEQEKDRSAVDKLIDLFGVRDFLKVRDQHHFVEGASTPAGML